MTIESFAIMIYQKTLHLRFIELEVECFVQFARTLTSTFQKQAYDGVCAQSWQLSKYESLILQSKTTCSVWSVSMKTRWNWIIGKARVCAFRTSEHVLMSRRVIFDTAYPVRRGGGLQEPIPADFGQKEGYILDSFPACWKAHIEMNQRRTDPMLPAH